jgi:hypothetical protein
MAAPVIRSYLGDTGEIKTFPVARLHGMDGLRP